jgi:hypothetical protein
MLTGFVSRDEGRLMPVEGASTDWDDWIRSSADEGDGKSRQAVHIGVIC